MKIYITYVENYNQAGRTAKGALVQQFAALFKNTEIEGPAPGFELKRAFETFVQKVNEKCRRGKPLVVEYNSNRQLHVSVGGASYSSSPICRILWQEVRNEFSESEIKNYGQSLIDNKTSI